MATAVKEKEKVGMQDEVVVEAPAREKVMPAVTKGMVREAAMNAAESYAPDEVEKHAQLIGEAWMEKLNQQAKAYKKQIKAIAQEAGMEATDIETPAGYTWWNLLLAGPFQVPAVGGPFQASKVIRGGDPAFMLAVIRRNPDPIPGTLISASTLMSPLDYSLTLQTINLTSVTSGPVFGPINATFGGGIFGFLNFHIITMNFTTPPEGRPDLYEANMVVDISGPVPGMPFAGFNTWILDPDAEPAIAANTSFFIFSGSMGSAFVPGLPSGVGGLQLDTPARFLVYRA
jgi:hypothetical protein